jgi:serine/threonine-protein kinase RsbW
MQQLPPSAPSAMLVVDHAFPSDQAKIEKAVNMVSDAVQTKKWTTAFRVQIAHCLQEAVVNAVKHGNKEDGSLEVRLWAMIDDQRCLIKVTDQGRGFMPSQIPDPTLEENLEKPTGRGFFMMRKWMDDVRVEVTDLGCSVIMEKNRKA